jgi:hypothetical protein
LKALFACAIAVALHGCGGPDFYAACEEADDCSDVVPEEATGECVEKEGGGFCTWSCTADPDCDGDQDDDFDFVCAPFESTTGMYCFPACLEGADEGEDCPGGYGCRSTGGGSDNRKICFPI